MKEEMRKKLREIFQSRSDIKPIKVGLAMKAKGIEKVSRNTWFNWIEYGMGNPSDDTLIALSEEIKDDSWLSEDLKRKKNAVPVDDVHAINKAFNKAVEEEGWKDMPEDVAAASIAALAIFCQQEKKPADSSMAKLIIKQVGGELGWTGRKTG